jgi:beta-glucosidase-like glycosyl hydrolase/CubicO group peptidase (beta-lactamase class C family)
MKPPAPRTRCAAVALLFVLPGLWAVVPGVTQGQESIPGRAEAGEPDPWVEGILGSLSLREAVGQLVFEWIPGSYASPSSPEFQDLERLVVEQGIGGVAISIGTPHAYAAKLNALQSRAPIPLLVTSDFENGGPGMRLNHSYALPSLLAQGGGTSFPPTMAFGAAGDERLAYEFGRVTAAEARAVGVHLTFAPVLDVNSNPENPIISTRSFGEDPEAVAMLGNAFIRGARSGGLLTTAKHFPGHGDTRTDSHLELPVVASDRDRLEGLELIPFRAAIEEGVDAVMTAHVAMPAILGPEGPPATLAPEIMTEILRGDMGFDGLLFTDALRMGALTRAYGVGETAVLALEAGADVLLVPADVGETVAAVVEAVEDGRISRARIDDSVRRILEAKARLGLPGGATVALEEVDEVVGSGAHLAFADTVAARSITLVRDGEGLVPALPDPERSVLSLTLSRPGDLVAGRSVDAELGLYFDRLSTARVALDASGSAIEEAVAAALEADLVVVGAYLPPQAGAGSVAIPEPMAALVREVALARPTVLVSLGSPYLLSAVPDVGSYLLAWGDREVSQRAAVRALVGAEPISGRLPVSLPPWHGLGEGLDRPAVGWVAAMGSPRPDALDETGIVIRRDPGEGGDPPDGAPVSGEPGTTGLENMVTWGRGATEAEVAAASVGMDEGGLAVVDSIIRAAIADSAFPGATLAVGRRGKLVRLRGYGRIDWSPDAQPADANTIWDLASLTKVVGTTTAPMLLEEEGRLSLDDRVVEHVAGWDRGDPRKADVTIRQLLLHRAGLPPFRTFFLEIQGRDAYLRAISDLPLDYAPGTRTVYSDIGLQTMAFVIEAVTGRRLDEFLRDRVWRPMSMADTDFNPPGEKLWRVAPTEVDEDFRGTHVWGVVHDENAFAQEGVAGHAGLFSTAADLSHFARMVLGQGRIPEEPGDRLLEPETIEAFTRRYDSTSTRALGWDTPSPRSSSGVMLSDRAFGHTGFTGTSMWIDPDLDLFVILLTNRVNPTRENTRLFPVRREVADQVARSVVDAPVEARR